MHNHFISAVKILAFHAGFMCNLPNSPKMFSTKISHCMVVSFDNSKFSILLILVKCRTFVGRA